MVDFPAPDAAPGFGAGPATLRLAPERASFFDEQARRRRDSWKLGLACLVLAAAMGLVVGTVVTPLLLLLAGLVLLLLDLLGLGVAGTLAQALAGWAEAKTAQLGVLLDAAGAVEGWAGLGAVWAPLAAFAPVFLPGAVAAVAMWLALRRLAARSGMADLLDAVGARAPRTDDPEERQLANLVAEMALAAGLPAPRLMMVDTPVANAAAVGSSHRDATLVVTRGLVDRMDRAETAAVLAHLVASVGNGDLAVVRSVLALFQTLGFFLTILDLPFRLSAWTALGGFLAALRPGTTSLGAERAAQGLEAALGVDSIDAMNRAMGGSGPRTWPRRLLMFPLIPLILANLMQKLVLNLWVMLGMGWVLALLWRARRYLADATAVRLTRDPGALADALRRLRTAGGLPPGGACRDYQFVHAGSGGGTLADRHAIALPLQPPLAARLRRLAALGAPVAPGETGGARLTPGAALALALLGTAVAPLVLALLLLVAWLSLVAMVLCLSAGLALSVLLLSAV